ncbi:MAG TPA: phosphate propanoyltransferase [Bacillota bacterium]|nr:phosphate propanoyltransferase [Bacillota bacterium]
MKIPVGVSNRHVHLSEEHVEQLFGKGYELQKFRDLTQPGQYAAIETVTILGPKGFINNVRVLGPIREETQVEISKTDGFTLGVHPPVRLSGSIDNTPGLTLIGPEGYVVIDKGTIVAKNHVHMSPDEAKQFSVDDHDTLMLKTLTDRPMILPEVIVRVNDQFKLDCHLDLDEGNAANVRTGDELAVVGKNGMLFA